VGNSGSGKTNLAKRLALQGAQHNNVIVHDPTRSAGWPESAQKFGGAAPFLESLDSFIEAHVFADECKILADHDQNQFNKLGYVKRHDGVLVYFIAQRTRMIPPNARNQCTKVFAFRQQLADAKILADEYHPAFEEAAKLGKNEFIFSDGFDVMRGKLDYSEYPPKMVAKGADSGNVDRVSTEKQTDEG